MTQPGIGPCQRCSTEAQLTADHIGPISLGFVHSPHFNAVCLACNSSKNNRMSYADVAALIALEETGEVVASWHVRALWNRCKGEVSFDEDALLLSRLMRVNQHHYLILLNEIRERGLADTLLQLLSPEFAEQRTRFIGLDPLTLQYERLERTPRQDTYARSHAARMVRIAYQALDDYAAKTKRNLQLVDDALLEEPRSQLNQAVEKAETEPSSWRDELKEILDLDVAARDTRLTTLFNGSYKPDVDFGYVRTSLKGYLDALSAVLETRFDAREALAITDALDES